MLPNSATITRDVVWKGLPSLISIVLISLSTFQIQIVTNCNRLSNCYAACTFFFKDTISLIMQACYQPGLVGWMNYQGFACWLNEISQMNFLVSVYVCLSLGLKLWLPACKRLYEFNMRVVKECSESTAGKKRNIPSWMSTRLQITQSY